MLSIELIRKGNLKQVAMCLKYFSEKMEEFGKLLKFVEEWGQILKRVI